MLRGYILTALMSGAVVTPLFAQGANVATLSRPVIAQRIDTVAVRLLEQADKALFEAKTLHGTVQTIRTVKGRNVSTPVVVEIWASKPGSFRVDNGATFPALAGTAAMATIREANEKVVDSLQSQMSGVKKVGKSVLITGEALEAMMASGTAKSKQVRIHTPERSLQYEPGKDTAQGINNVYFKSDVADNSLQAFFGSELRHVGVWTPNRLHELLLRSLSYLGKKTWNNKSYDVVEWTYENAYLLPEDTIVYTTRFFIGDDHLVRRSVTQSSTGLLTGRQFVLELDAPVAPKKFLPVVTGWQSGKNGMMLAYDKALPVTPIPASKERTSLVGKPFIALTPKATLLDGGAFTMDKLLRGKKGALVWMWTTGCSSCTEEFPLVEKLCRELGPKGISVVALDYVPGDEANARKMRAYNRTSMPIAFGAKSWTDFMTDNGGSFVVLDSKGTVVYQGGFDQKAIQQAMGELL